MSVFEFEIQQEIVPGMKLKERNVVSAFLQITKPDCKDLVKQLAIDGIAKLNLPSIEEREHVLDWLNKNPFKVKSEHGNVTHFIAMPIYTQYSENTDGISVKKAECMFLDALYEALNTYVIPTVHLKRKWTANIVADLVLKGTYTSIYNYDDLREVLGVSKKHYFNFSQFERIFKSINNDLSKNGHELIYSRLSPEPRCTDISIELLDKY